MYKKVLTLDNLVTFCETHSINRFSAQESGYVLCVQAPAALFESDDDLSVLNLEQYSDDEQTLYLPVKMFHTGRNRNRSAVTEESARNCLGTIKYKPVLANFTDVNDEWDFTSHDFVENEDGTTTYLEHQVGCMTADQPVMIYDKDKDRHYVCAIMALPREYTKAAEIIERKGGTKVSVELAIKDMSYSAKEKLLMLNEIEVMGLTLLGVDPETGEEIKEGMEGSKAILEDFSVKNNAIQIKDDNDAMQAIMDLQKSLDKYIQAFNAENFKEGGKTMNKLEQLLEKYNVELASLPFASEIEGKSDEELEEMFSKHFEQTEPENTQGAENNEPEQTEPFEANGSEPVASDPETQTEPSTENPETAEFSEKPEVVEHDSMTINLRNVSKTFEISLDEKQYALCDLVNDTYGEQDDTWYAVIVYESYLVMVDYWNNIAYRQGYSETENDTFALTGERVKVHSRWLTAEEEAKIDDTATQYAALLEEKARVEREAVLNDESFEESFKETESWKTLVKEAGNYNATDLAVKANALYGEFCKQKVQSVHNTRTNTVGISHQAPKKTKSYPTLFGC